MKTEKLKPEIQVETDGEIVKSFHADIAMELIGKFKLIEVPISNDELIDFFRKATLGTCQVEYTVNNKLVTIKNAQLHEIRVGMSTSIIIYRYFPEN